MSSAELPAMVLAKAATKSNRAATRSADADSPRCVLAACAGARQASQIAACRVGKAGKLETVMKRCTVVCPPQREQRISRSQKMLGFMQDTVSALSFLALDC